MTEYPYDENPDPNNPNQKAERLLASVKAAIEQALECGRSGKHDEAVRWLSAAQTRLWAHEGNLADLLRANENGTSYDIDDVRSGRLTRDGIEI